MTSASGSGQPTPGGDQVQTTVTIATQPPAHPHTTADRILATPRMRTMLAELVEARGPLHVLVEWPLSARCIPADDHRTGSRDVIIGHVASCPIFIDLYYLAWFFDNGVLLLDIDPEHSAVADGTLRLLLNPVDGRPLANNA
jgi:uncharacterized protein (DUF779 family)